MTRRKIRPGPVGADVDLETEDLRLSDGERLTPELAEQIAERALARHRGRPSITGRRQRTPSLTVRVDPQTRAALEAIAKSQGRELAEVSREALDEYVSRHAS